MAVDGESRSIIRNTQQLLSQQHHASAVQLAHSPTSGEWTLLAIDLAAAVTRTGATFSSVRRLQLCAHMHVRGAYTSDLVYSSKVCKQSTEYTLAFLMGRIWSMCTFIPPTTVHMVNMQNNKNLLDPCSVSIRMYPWR